MDAKLDNTINDIAHEIWASAQLHPCEGIVDGVERIARLLAELKELWEKEDKKE